MSFQRPNDRTYLGGSPQQFDATEAELGHGAQPLATLSGESLIALWLIDLDAGWLIARVL